MIIRLLSLVQSLRAELPYYEPVFNIVKFTEDINCDTMSINEYAEIYYNKQFCNSLKDKELSAVIRHEIEHYIRGHHFRGFSLQKIDESISHSLLNVAMDLEINSDILGLPSGCLLPKDFGLPDRLLFEQYIPLILNKVNTMTGRSSKTGNITIKDDNSNSMDVAKSIYDDISNKVDRMIGSSNKTSGNVNIKYKYVNKDWKSVLKNFIFNKISLLRDSGHDYTLYTKTFHKRGLDDSIILPSYYSDRLIVNILFAVDVSGSMCKFIPKVFDLVFSIKKNLPDNVEFNISIWTFNVDIVQEFNNITELPQIISVNGGTDVNCIFNKMTKENLYNYYTIVLTDGFTYWGNHKKLYKNTVTILTNDKSFDNCPTKKVLIKL